jgi:hypothetical protein
MTARLRLKIELMYDEGRGDAKEASEYVLNYLTSDAIHDVRVAPGRAACGMFVVFEPGIKLRERTLDKVARQAVNALQSMHYADNITMTRWLVDATKVEK